MLATAEHDHAVIEAEFTVDEPTQLPSRLECPVALPVVHELRVKYAGLTINGIHDKSGLSAVDEARRHCKRVRVQVENWRKEQNEDALKHQRRVNTAARLIREPLEALEESLAGRQKAVTDEVERLKREAEEKLKSEKAAKLKSRMDDLQAVSAYFPPIEVEALSDEAFAALLDQKQHEEFDRIEAGKLLKKQMDDEAESLRVEREKLAAQRAELDRQKAEHAAEQRKIDEEKARLAKVESERLEALKREREEAESQECIRLAAEKHAADMAEREEASRVRAEKLRPDKEKLLGFVESLLLLEVPELSADARLVRALVVSRVINVGAELRTLIEARLK